MMIICTKLFSNPTIHDKVMGQTQTSFTEAYAQRWSAKCDLDFWPSNMVPIHDTSICHDNYLCQFISISNHAWQSYGPDTNRFHWSLCTKFQSTLWCYLWPSSCLGYIILSKWAFEPNYFQIPPCRTKLLAGHTYFTKAYARSVRANWDLGLWPTCMFLVLNISTCHDDYFCQIIFKSHHAWGTYGSDTNRFYWSLCTKLNWGLWPWPLT